VIRYRKSISLTNLIADAPIVPELILGDFSPERMAEEVGALLGPGSESRVGKMRSGFDRIRRVLGERSPSERVAEEILDLADGRGGLG
jgi:lipid-A-disaccharide synthase